ncbi:B3/4 domain-containing protein [Dysgonomonas sp. Marseille-P4361]|uniref:B3/B4 domain-containing protein n=1 Tax=Dysgonomonas sp. Marseille-P4361 TaxID=2161820 RepID=UPI000D54CC68|nr:phenylalanine--tRNA ligase beta subunit-related protein [Dysgonomonas sp. Marseille-P4361]
MNFIVSEKIKSVCPQFAGAAIYGRVTNSAHNAALWEQINSFTEEYKQNHKLEDIKKNPAILATRKAYKALGKDPNRYRPSAEALCRRILRDIPLYQIDTLVDLINLVSLKTGYSIGGFDAEKIDGGKLILGVGEADEPFDAIGRGILNIEGLPVYRDNMGGIGTPTSDEERTKIGLSTSRLLTIINGYNGKEGLEEAVAYMKTLLEEYAELSDCKIYYF